MFECTGMMSTLDVAGFDRFTRFMASNLVLFEAVSRDAIKN